ncbi:MAG: FtsW/RodA/SpoVE family cell cycle protein [Patescibacteria group bacterium]|jgi:rod shape determining protein RodA
MRSIWIFFKSQNWLLIAPALLLLIYGLVISFSLASAQQAADYSLFWKQALVSGVGVIMLFVFSAIDYRYFRAWSGFIYAGSILLLISVLLFGETIRATRGWFVFFGITFQVVEVAKICMVIVLSAYFVRMRSTLFYARDILLSGLGVGILVILTFLQPDVGSGLLLLGIFLGMLLLVRTRRVFIILIVGVLIASSVFGWFFVLKDFHKDRIMTFLDPSRDPLGVGYNLTQSTVAIGSGGLFGRGLTLGPQSRLNFLPERQNDFIFAVIGEALGFAGVVLLFFLFGVLFFAIIRVARKSRDDFGVLLAGGVGISLILQMVVNIGTNIGFLPIAGLPLPFLSAGGSSLIMNLIGVGIVASIDVRQRFGLA